jgi:hypothetical protein
MSYWHKISLESRSLPHFPNTIPFIFNFIQFNQLCKIIFRKGLTLLYNCRILEYRVVYSSKCHHTRAIQNIRHNHYISQALSPTRRNCVIFVTLFGNLGRKLKIIRKRLDSYRVLVVYSSMELIQYIKVMISLIGSLLYLYSGKTYLTSLGLYS